MRLEITPRADTSRTARLLAPLCAAATAMLIVGLLLASSGRSPLLAFRVYFVEPLGDAWGLQEVAIKAVPLLLIALGLSFCVRARLRTIGAEGQYVRGALAGCALGQVAP